MLIGYLTLLSGLLISAVAIYYSVEGLVAIYPAMVVPIVVMGIVIELGKLSLTVWLKQFWDRAPVFLKAYMMPAVAVLMLITSIGVFGFLSKAHSDQSLVSGDVQSRIAIYDEKIKTAKENIEANRKQLKQMDEAVDQVMGRSTDEKGADKANAIRKSQQRDRSALAKDIEANQKLVATLNDEAAPIRAEVRKVEAEVGPIKYIAAFIYGTAPDESMLERAVTWIIILIVVVFDPLAVIMLLASQMTFGWAREQKEKIWIDDQAEELTEAFNKPNYPQDDGPLTDSQVVQVKETVTEFEGVREPGGEWIQTGPEIEYQFIEEFHEEDPPPVTADSTKKIEEIIEPPVPIEQWNNMIAEAEKAAEESAMADRLAKGETYIDGNGSEIKYAPTMQERLDDNQTFVSESGTELPLESEDSKKKTYMIKDPTGQIQVKNRD